MTAQLATGLEQYVRFRPPRLRSTSRNSSAKRARRSSGWKGV